MTPPVHKWKPDERDRLMAELDAAYFMLYGIEREDLIYVLTTFQGTRKSGSAQTLFQRDASPDEVLSESGQRIVEAYDDLRPSS